MTVKDAVEFLVKFGKDNTCQGYTPAKIAKQLTISIKNNTLFWATNTENKLVGVGYGYVNTRKQIFTVWNLVTTERWAIASMLQKVLELYPNYQLYAFRRNKLIKYNTNKLLVKLSKQ